MSNDAVDRTSKADNSGRAQNGEEDPSPTSNLSPHTVLLANRLYAIELGHETWAKFGVAAPAAFSLVAIPLTIAASKDLTIALLNITVWNHIPALIFPSLTFVISCVLMVTSTAAARTSPLSALEEQARADEEQLSEAGDTRHLRLAEQLLSRWKEEQLGRARRAYNLMCFSLVLSLVTAIILAGQMVYFFGNSNALHPR